MKSFLRIGLTAITIAFFFSALTVAETKAQAFLQNILNRMDAHNKALTSLQSSVKMLKYNSQLDEKDLYEGKAKYVPLKERDALVRIDWIKPAEESLAVVGKQYILYRPRLGQAIIGKVDSAKSGGKGANNALAFINMSKQQLKANYSIKYIGEEKVTGGTLTWHLELMPKVATSYKSAELWVDSDGMPIQAKVIENNNDATTIFLFDIQKNIKINTKVFVIDYPKKTTKVIEG